MLKAEIRKLYLQKRLELDSNSIQVLSKKITDRFFQFLPDNIFTIHVYLPMEVRGEINTWPIIHKLWEMDLNTVVPVMQAEDTSLSSRVLTPDIKLKQNFWGVPEPVGAQQADKNVIDLVIVPLLAFDKRGFRVGYGKGYYDGFLGSFEEQPLKVGLSIFEPIDEISDTHAADIPLDFCITPNQIFYF
jgi:5-formyltetrahydrofolate cyclo-ligase